MHLERVIAALAPADVLRRAPVEIRDLSYDARTAGPGALFFCVPGGRADGHDFAPEAVANGAVALVVERPLELDVPQLVVADARRAMGVAADEFFGRPSEELQIAGVTGTNGKTTTAFLLYAILAAAGRRPGLLGTIESRVGGERRPAIRTTPEAIDLQRAFREMLDAGDRSCAMEATSHGSELGRLDRVRFSVLVFTNLSQDHLDFHGTMERYFEAKRRLFTEERPPAAINVGDEWGRKLAADRPDALTFGFADDAEVGPQALEGIDLKLRGRFNAENALGALAASRLLGIDDDAIARGLESVRGVPGRFESVSAGPAVRGDRRLLAQARGARERPPHGARAHERPADLRLRLRRRPRPRQAPDHGRDRLGARRRRDRDLGQPAQRGSAGDHRRDPDRGHAARWRSSQTARPRSSERSPRRTRATWS